MEKTEKKGIKKSPKKGKKKKTLKQKLMIALLVILLIIISLGGVAVGVIYHYIGKMNIVEDKQGNYEIDYDIDPEVIDAVHKDDDDVTTDADDSPKEDIEALENQIRENLENNASDFMNDKDVYNVLLIGTDARSAGERGRSDSMILVSINKRTRRVVMTSFLRDIYLAIPNVESTRLNHAYAYGGADLLMDTLEQNFRIQIDKYVQVNFFSFVDAIDSVGGVEIDVTDAEVSYINNGLREINRLKGNPENKYQISRSGKQTLNGAQALSYARIRYIGTDFGRTERQRKVLEQLIQKTGKLSLIEKKEMLDLILPEVTTNIQEDEMFSLILNADKYMRYERRQCRVPNDGTWWNLTIRGMAVLGMDFEKNIDYIRSNIYYD